jgi:SIR2-like protein
MTIKPLEVMFLQGKENLIDGDDLKQNLDKIKQKIADLSNVKNVHFLLGAGASSGAIPTMKDMVASIDYRLTLPIPPPIPSPKATTTVLPITVVSNTKLQALFNKIKSSTKENLEDILGVLYSKRAYLEGSGDKLSDDYNETLSLIKIIESEMFKQINIDFSTDKSKDSLALYNDFYQKVTLRNKDLSRVNIFTTNNDLFNEKALDYSNINYNNGFGGGLDRVFNPARFNYTFSRKIDAEVQKYEPLDNMVYLYKLHGSISWRESKNNSFFQIQEVPTKHGENVPDDNILIYPTPLKQNKSLGSPYSDLIREFQKKLLQPHSVLFVIGYSFSDEHLNNIIYQALASNSAISVVVFGNYSDKEVFKVNDRRIYKIFGDAEGNKIHYFKYIVDNFLPDLEEFEDINLLKKFMNNLADEKSKAKGTKL